MGKEPKETIYTLEQEGWKTHVTWTFWSREEWKLKVRRQNPDGKTIQGLSGLFNNFFISPLYPDLEIKPDDFIARDDDEAMLIQKGNLLRILAILLEPFYALTKEACDAIKKDYAVGKSAPIETTDIALTLS